MMKTESEGCAVKTKQTVMSKGRFWGLMWGLGLAGQLCWNIENQWFNTFVYAKIAKDSSIVTLMVITSALVTTFSTFLFGTLSDRLGTRRRFVSIGYIAWGVFTILFGLTEFIAKGSVGAGAKASVWAAVLVVLADDVMSFFGSMGNDFGFSAWSNDNTTDKMLYDGLQSCAAAAQLMGGITSCRYGCMGLGDCQQACEYGAIQICNGLAQVDPEQCRGCSKCVAACPKGILSLVPRRKQAVVRCSNCDKAKDTMAVCKIGCIGCGKCVRTCPCGAVTVENGVAKVAPQKCTACGQCVEACPRHVITLL